MSELKESAIFAQLAIAAFIKHQHAASREIVDLHIADTLLTAALVLPDSEQIANMRIWVSHREMDGGTFIFSCSGRFTVDVLSEIEKSLLENKKETFTEGAGDYIFDCTWYAGQYGFEGACEIPPGWEFEPTKATHPQPAIAPRKGQQVSIDMSTGDDDATNRIFGELTGDQGSDGTWCAVFTEKNYAQPATALEPVSLTDVDSIAERFAASYASPHHFVMSVVGLRDAAAEIEKQRSQP